MWILNSRLRDFADTELTLSHRVELTGTAVPVVERVRRMVSLFQRKADESLVAPSQHILLIGTPTTLSCLINYPVMDLANRYGDDLKKHQEKLGQSCRENDVLCSMKRRV